MSTQVQYRRGTATQNNSFVGALAEITVDTTNKTLRVHDGATAGGSNIATVAYVDNAISALSSDSISNGTSIVKVASSGGNVYANVGGSTILNLSSSGANITGYATASGNVTGGNLVTAGVVDGNGAPLTNLNGSNIASGTIATARISGSYTGITGTGALNAGSITSGFGAIDIGTDTVTCGGIVNANANGVGNIGSSTTYFNTVFAKATSAQYADVAEKYLADQSYIPGTVLEIGGINEVTETTAFASARIAGVVSTNPAFIMNSGETSDTAVEIALLGRVPCRVVGNIQKGDLLCSSHLPGVATSLPLEQFVPGSVVGKALENFASDQEGVIEVLVGRL